MQQQKRYYLIGEPSSKDYRKFLSLAFSNSDFFSVSTFKSVRKKDLSDHYLSFLDEISRDEVDVYSFKHLPQHYERGQQIHVYSINEHTRKVIESADVERLYDWLIPLLPEDLSFFKGKRVWFNSISHTKLSIAYTNDKMLLCELSKFFSIREG